MQPFRIEYFEEIDSTNNKVKAAIEAGEPEGLVVRARIQRSGYGRQGRRWSSPAGGLYQSLLLRPAVPGAQLPTLALVAALAVRAALLEAVGCNEDTIQVKWPNDIVCLQGKLCGISCEAHAGGVCVGIGANVMRPALPEEILGKNTPAYLCDMAEGRILRHSVSAIGNVILEHFANRYDCWQSEGFDIFVDEINACSALADCAVRLEDASGEPTCAGIVSRIDSHGRLVVCAQGEEIPVSSGEVHLAST